METLQVRKEIRKMEDEVFQEISKASSAVPRRQEMFYKKAKDRSTYEQQLVELINRQIRTKDPRPNGTEIREERQLKGKYEELQRKLANLPAKPALPQAFVTTDLSHRPARTSPRQRKETFPAYRPCSACPTGNQGHSTHTTGRRLAGELIASPDNPLSTRVIVSGSGSIPERAVRRQRL